jgi:mandelate racemase
MTTVIVLRVARRNAVTDSPLIRGLRVRTVEVPMPHPHRTASGTITSSPLVLTDLLTDEGVVGSSYVFCYSALALQPTALLVRGLEPLLVEQLVEPVELGRQVAATFRLLGGQGLAGMAMAAIDMAAWDALARAHGVSLARLLGAAPRPVPMYGSIGYDDAESSAREAAAWVQRGVGGVKAKIGHPDVREDLAVIRAIRRAVGDDVALMVDYNQSLMPVEAIERARRLDGEGLTWIEEPTLAEDYAGLAAVARAVATPVQAGENWWGPQELAKAVAAGASDHVMPDVMKIGGVTGWQRAAAIAAGAGRMVSSHLFVEVSAHLLCATPTAHWLEYADWFNPILARPLRIEDGYAVPDDRPGSGIEWDEQAVARYAVS